MSVTKKKKYTLGNEIKYGYISRIYLELFESTCYSKKIYSVQAEDFFKEFPKDTPAVIYLPSMNYGTDWISYDMETGRGKVGNKHVFVVLTPEMVQFLQQRGIESKAINYASNATENREMSMYIDCAWVSERSCSWKDCDLSEDDVVLEEIVTEKKKTNIKAILALGVALISLLK